MDGTFLEATFAGNTVLRWMIAAAAMLIAVTVLRILKALAMRYIGRLARRTATWADDVLLEGIRSTRSPAYLAVAVLTASAVLELPEGIGAALAAVGTILLLLQAGVWTQGLTRSVVAHSLGKQDDKRSSTMAAGIIFVAKLLIWSVVSLLVLANLGVRITAVIAGLGVGGIAVALAVQGILGDLFASLSMYFDRPFDIGDFIIVGDYLGTVDRIGLRTTRIKSLGGEQIIFANDDIVKSRVRNYARMEERRIVFSFGIEYNLPAEKVERAAAIARQVIEETPDTRFDRVHFKTYGDFSLVFEAVYYVLQPDYNLYMEKQHSINMGIYRRFEEEGIPFAFPTRTIHLKGSVEIPGNSPSST
mgnify:CR=1 FL=1